jgi:lactate permease
MGDLAPFGFLLAALLAVNLIPAWKELTTQAWVVRVVVVPIHTITYTPLASAYIYLFAAFGLAVKTLGVGREEVRQVVRRSLGQGWRALTAMALFGAMGQMIAYTGYSSGFSSLEQTANIPWVLAQGLKTATGSWYPVFVPLLGWVGTFLTGYGVASLMLFGELQVRAAELLGASAIWLAAGLAVGASLGSISSPFKIAIAAPMCGAVGREGEILRLTIPLGIAASLVIGAILWLMG